jgi:hypothetical protein
LQETRIDRGCGSFSRLFPRRAAHPPQPLGQQISEPGEAFPLRGGAGKAVVEACINNEILFERVRNGG